MDSAGNHIQENPFLDWQKCFKKSLDIRKGDMKNKKAGSILVDNQSKIIWTKMLQ